MSFDFHKLQRLYFDKNQINAPEDPTQLIELSKEEQVVIHHLCRVRFKLLKDHGMLVYPQRRTITTLGKSLVTILNHLRNVQIPEFIQRMNLTRGMQNGETIKTEFIY